MAIKRISELDPVVINYKTLADELLTQPDSTGRRYFKESEFFNKYIFETSEFVGQQDERSFYASKQISIKDLGKIVTLETNSLVDAMISGDITFTGNKTFVGNLSCFGDNNYIKNLTVDQNITINGECDLNNLICNNLSVLNSVSTSCDISCTSDIYCNILHGTAMRACWGDLAEMYEADFDYEPGTVVQFGGEKEITAARTTANAVITTSPGVILNNGYDTAKTAEYGYPINNTVKGIALTGRVPVKIMGKIDKFENITFSKDYPGIAVRCTHESDVVIGKALQGKTDSFGVGLVECVVQMVL